ncbi:MAG TPA: RagB/SusD family nutrient uptake outer membrane protein [Cyclobacteriaceae bacterium]|nr:RagB/SusD family nutrient uptake outer membrane protein [Cyclobacteriaceae bacterium]
MRSLKYILSSLALAAIFVSCEDALTEKPKDFISPGNFFTNQTEAEQALAGAYNAIWVGDNYMNLFRHHAEYTLARGSWTSVGNYGARLNADQYGRVDGIWATLYTTIDRANLVIDRVPGIDNIPAAEKARILAEAHFLRGRSYYELVKGWGGVPLRLEPFTGTSEVGAPRATVDEVFELINSDLAIAERDLPGDVGQQTGKASKWATKMLLAQINLELKNWSVAAAKANEVINSGKYSLVPVAAWGDFSKIFWGLTSSEDIHSYHFSVTRTYSHINWYHGTGTPYNRGEVFGFTMLVDAAAPLITAWNPADLRKEFNIYSQYVNAAGVMVQTDAQNRYRFRKFVKDPAGNAVYSIPIFRLAEAYLIYAEASNMADGGPSASALEALNKVKRRGYGYDINTASPVDVTAGTTQAQFADLVIQERAYELFFENDSRWWDLKRTGKYKSVFQEAGKTMTDFRLLLPIPQIEVDNNPEIEPSNQNPGY